MIGIGYLEIEVIVAQMSGLQDRDMIRRRFKYLQRMSYPLNSNTGRGRKAVLGLGGVLQVLVALELMQVGASPTRAVRILRTNWDELLPALALGWLASRKPPIGPLRNLLVMNAGAFGDAGRSENPYEPVVEPFRPTPALDLTVDARCGGATTRVVLDPARLASHLILHSLSEASSFTDDELDASYLELWNASFKQNPDSWVEEAIRSAGLQKAEISAAARLRRMADGGR